MFVRNVGHLMTNDAIVDTDGKAVFEAQHHGCPIHRPITPRLRPATSGSPLIINSRTGSIYIVKPKMHGPAEVAFTQNRFSRVEDVLLPQTP